MDVVWFDIGWMDELVDVLIIIWTFEARTSGIAFLHEMFSKVTSLLSCFADQMECLSKVYIFD